MKSKYVALPKKRFWKIFFPIVIILLFILGARETTLLSHKYGFDRNHLSQKKEGRPKVLVVTCSYMFGERLAAKRFLDSFARLNIPATEVIIPSIETNGLGYKWHTNLFLKLARKWVKPDLVLCITPLFLPHFEDVPQFSLVTGPDTNPPLRLFLHNHLFLASESHDYITNYALQPWQKLTLEIYPSVGKTDFETPQFKSIFYCGANWDPLRNSDNYRWVYQQLDQQGIITFYGPKEAWHMYQNYRGLIPMDSNKFHTAMRECGIGLCLHSQLHLDSATPTARIFELAAAGSIIICDDHPFVRKHFKDSVLYINHRLGREEILAQIRAHYNWIITNPEKAHQKAQRAHQIFCEHFTLESMIKRIIEAYEKNYTHTN
ncbi:MAG: glycosyltransferase family 1 protein [Alphaproteobacteria bacterium]|nr:glycosyltransferase family 1 protein [Alphaproteobacteria bacterium]OJV45297.1 MAG: hypothetical protein BGO28_00760 [Alphaproteobacteria bacterium 43-37]